MKLPPALDLKIESLPVAALRVNERNARTHSAKQIGKLAEIIDRFGFLVPITVDAELTILSGHARVVAARKLGMANVPAIRVEHLDPAQRRAFAIADNRLAELAGWDRAILAQEFEALLELDFDVALTGFELPEIDLIICEAGGEGEADAGVDEPLAPSDAPSVSRPGDLWLLGDHRIFCGSALDAGAYERLMGSERAAMVFTDPPYNLRIAGNVSGLGRVKHGEFAMASGEMSGASFTTFLTSAFQLMASHSRDGAIHFVCMDWRHMREILEAGHEVYSELKNLCVWNKDNGGMGSLYRSKHELVFVFKQGRSAHTNAVELGRFGRNRTNVWDYPGQNTFHKDRTADLGDHPTVKPVALVADAIRDVSHRGDLVLEPFSGSGTTILAAEQTGRRARAIELEPAYVDVAIRRWERQTGRTAVHVETGMTFAETASTRHADASALAAGEGGPAAAVDIAQNDNAERETSDAA